MSYIVEDAFLNTAPIAEYVELNATTVRHKGHRSSALQGRRFIPAGVGFRCCQHSAMAMIGGQAHGRSCS